MPKKSRTNPRRRKTPAPALAAGETDVVSSASTRELTSDERSGFSWGPAQIGSWNYAFLVICVAAQFATLMLSWPAWQVRSDPPNLPWIASTPQFPFGVLLAISLGLVLVSPKRMGLLIHFAALAVAMGSDQFRCQPQVISIAIMTAACVWKPMRLVAVWYLVSMWGWAGIHKLASPDWLGYGSYWLLTRLQLDATQLYFGFGLFVGISEILLAVVAWLKPRWAAIGCVGLHLGIAISMIAIDWNHSVLPWNICTAVVGAWLLWIVGPATGKSAEPLKQTTSRFLPLPKSSIGKLAVVLLLIVPAGFYWGLVRHSFAFSLYSDNLPLASITQQDGFKRVESWDEIGFPLPHEQKAYRDYFLLTSSPGEKLHVNEPRWGLASHFYLHATQGRLKEISELEFLDPEIGNVAGVPLDDPRKTFWLERANATLLKRSAKEMVYAIKFEPKSFKPELLTWLDGLPNLEQIQLAGCDVKDNDLKLIPPLHRLGGIGLSHTTVTDAGLLHLKKYTNLFLIERTGTTISDEAMRRLGVSD
jgi:hypothetical protein